ncbi:glycosyltransferase family 2 protein [Ruicaihuangia caeni]|uniref:Glycosyltransferase family 2 protein n=1 Tax=Ruicaihuangia caeni TaxID=3042517 RepID=A0AAW6T6D3_9MICO|nr:glycosyltransferase family 2 protein [Klugiella sp. YN-L-19]MDI2099395.1 glycosyltransferase family 2 protein [Klugiella sp. YN-L-19]
MTASSSTPPPRLGVITVGYRSEEELARFLPTVRAATAKPVEVVIADNRPTWSDGRGAVVAATAPSPAHVNATEQLAAASGARYLSIPANPGYGGAINRAVTELPGSVEWMLISNPDVLLEPGAIDALVEVGDTDPSIGAVGPAILNEDGTIYPSARRIPSLRNGVGHALFVNVWPGNRWSRAYLDAPDADSAQRDAGWLSGACVLVRRSVFDSIGGFDDGYFMYFEDVDLGYRIGKAGYRNVYAPQARVLHTGAHSTSGESAAMIDAHHRSAARFLARRYPGALLWPVRAALRVGLWVRSQIAKRRARAAAAD